MPNRRKNNNRPPKINIDSNQMVICQTFTILVNAYLRNPATLMLALISKLEWMFLGKFNELVTSETPNTDFKAAVEAGLPIYGSPKMDGSNVKLELSKLETCQSEADVVACFFFKQECPYEKRESKQDGDLYIPLNNKGRRVREMPMTQSENGDGIVLDTGKIQVSHIREGSKKEIYVYVRADAQTWNQQQNVYQKHGNIDQLKQCIRSNNGQLELFVRTSLDSKPQWMILEEFNSFILGRLDELEISQGSPSLTMELMGTQTFDLEKLPYLWPHLPDPKMRFSYNIGSPVSYNQIYKEVKPIILNNYKTELVEGFVFSTVTKTHELKFLGKMRLDHIVAPYDDRQFKEAVAAALKMNKANELGLQFPSEDVAAFEAYKKRVLALEGPFATPQEVQDMSQKFNFLDIYKDALKYLSEERFDGDPPHTLDELKKEKDPQQLGKMAKKIIRKYCEQQSNKVAKQQRK